MASWAERVAKRATALCPDRLQVRALTRAFRFVAQEWADTDAEAGSPLSSGITSDGVPVELSVRQRPARSAVDLRFIAQPGHITVPLTRDRAFLRRRAVGFSSEYAGLAAASFVAALTDAFPVDDNVEIGNFFLWLGLDLQGVERTVVKVYVNPWACKVEDRGMPFAETVVAMAGFGTVVAAMQTLVMMQIPANLHIVGVNLDADGARSVKLYFPLPSTSRQTLLRLADAFPGSEGFSESLLRISQIGARSSGEVHAALVWGRNTTQPLFRASLYCPDWFASDADVLAAVSAINRFDHQQPLPDAASNRRWFTFLGIDGDGTALYSHG